MTLWARMTVGREAIEGDRIIHTAARKEWLSTPSSYMAGVKTYDVELKGEIEVPDEKETSS